MWTIDNLEDIRDDCMKDIFEIFPELREKLSKPRIEINHKTSSTMAKYSKNDIEISAYLLAGSTPRILLQTLIMKGIIRGQICKMLPDLYYEEIMYALKDRFPQKYDFEEYKDLQKYKVQIPKKQEQPYKYAVRCPGCGKIFKFKRICNTVLHPGDYICTKCNVPLEDI